MIVVKPFKGICYNIDIVGDLSSVLSPPYDIIDDELQERLLKNHPYNFVRIDWGKRYPDDDEKNNVYTRAKAYFDNWLKEKILVHDSEDCFYVLRQDFEIDGKCYSRLGFYGLYKVTEFSFDTIMPHEKTQSGPKEDRYLLTKSCGAFFSAVFSIYEDKELTIENLYEQGLFGEPFVTFTDYQGVKNYLYKSKNPSINAKISQMMSEKRLFIADGHHRYETALRISKEMKDNERAQFTLMFFSNTENSGLLILPTYRLLKDISYNNDDLETFLHRYFHVSKYSIDQFKFCLSELKEAREKHAFAIVTPSQIYFLKLKAIEEVSAFFPENMHDVLRTLDVNILFYVIIKGFFGVTEEDVKNQRKIFYTKDGDDALNKVLSGKAKVALLLNPPDIASLSKVAKLNETMPQKSTYFYPKIPSGAVIYSFL